MTPPRLEARMDSLFSFPVGLFHPLQHAGYPGALRVARHPPQSRRPLTVCNILLLMEIDNDKGI